MSRTVTNSRARWWQRECPYRWSDHNTWHIHDCRLPASGEPHTHVCDCGATNP
jgi:hypothetical protein